VGITRRQRWCDIGRSVGDAAAACELRLESDRERSARRRRCVASNRRPRRAVYAPMAMSAFSVWALWPSSTANSLIRAHLAMTRRPWASGSLRLAAELEVWLSCTAAGARNDRPDGRLALRAAARSSTIKVHASRWVGRRPSNAQITSHILPAGDFFNGIGHELPPSPILRNGLGVKHFQARDHLVY
jgi:hypothetical protein